MVEALSRVVAGTYLPRGSTGRPHGNSGATPSRMGDVGGVGLCCAVLDVGLPDALATW